LKAIVRLRVDQLPPAPAVDNDVEGSMAKGTTAGGKSEVRQPLLNPAERRAILWSATAFLAVAVAGLLFAPGLRLLWVVLLVFGVAAVPQALRRDR